MEGMSSSGGLEIGISCLTGPHFRPGGQKHTHTHHSVSLSGLHSCRCRHPWCHRLMHPPCCSLWKVLLLEGQWLAEHHQPGGTEWKPKGQRGKDKVGIVLCRHCKYCTQHMGKAWRRLVTARGKEQDQCARADRAGSIARVHIRQ